MIPRPYPQMQVRTKLGLMPVVAVVFGLYVLGHHGVVEFRLDADGVSPHHKAKPPAERGHSAPPPAPSKPTVADIPGNYLALYRSAAKTCRGLGWGVLAGIGEVESNHGRLDAPGVRSGVNSYGCCSGPMQFNIRNGPPSTWDRYGRGNVYDPRDAISATARMLCANGIGAHVPASKDPCPGVLGTASQHRAIRAYNHACWYVAQILTLAHAYQGGGGR